jgi:hypothetical protein
MTHVIKVPDIIPSQDETHVERVDYSKTVAYTDNPIFHSLDDYYKDMDSVKYLRHLLNKLKSPNYEPPPVLLTL